MKRPKVVQRDEVARGLGNHLLRATVPHLVFKQPKTQAQVLKYLVKQGSPFVCTQLEELGLSKPGERQSRVWCL